MPDDSLSDMFDTASNISVEDRRKAEGLVVDVTGYEGPLDLLLTLARSQ